MRAASIKLVQAGQASVCSPSCLLSNGSAGQTHSQRGTACYQLLFDDSKRERDTHMNVGQRDLAKEVSGALDWYQ